LNSSALISTRSRRSGSTCSCTWARECGLDLRRVSGHRRRY
jgi:hypothetical protein